MLFFLNFCYEYLIWLYRIIFEKIVCEREWIRKLGLQCRVIKCGHKICREKERKRKEKKENCHPHWARLLYLSQFLHFYTMPRKSVHTFPIYHSGKVVSKGERAYISSSSWSQPLSLLFSGRQFMLSNIVKFGFDFRVLKIQFYMIFLI